MTILAVVFNEMKIPSLRFSKRWSTKGKRMLIQHTRLTAFMVETKRKNKSSIFFVGSGLGRALAISLAKIGSTLILWDINKEGNEETAAEIKKFGGKVSTYTVDLSKRDQIYATAEQVIIGLCTTQPTISTAETLVHSAG